MPHYDNAFCWTSAISCEIKSCHFTVSDTNDSEKHAAASPHVERFYIKRALLERYMLCLQNTSLCSRFLLLPSWYYNFQTRHLLLPYSTNSRLHTAFFCYQACSYIDNPLLESCIPHFCEIPHHVTTFRCTAAIFKVLKIVTRIHLTVELLDYTWLFSVM